jgi:hypothetical protein
MRGVVAIAVVVAALGCQSPRYGTYLTIDGDSQAIGFDRVELWFGVTSAATALTTPGNHRVETLYDRQFDQRADVIEVPRRDDGTRARETVVYLPPDAYNVQLKHLIAVAYAGQTPVGIAEAVGLPVEVDTVITADLELEPYVELTATTFGRGAERWGDEIRCIAYRKERGDPRRENLVAIVPPEDRDCDGLPASVDCDDAMACRVGTTCGASITCGSGESCALGCLTDGTCRPRVCVAARFCEPECAAAGAEKLLGCGLDSARGRFTAGLTRVGDTLCPHTISIELAVPCANPGIDALMPADGSMLPVIGNGTRCELTLVRGQTLNARYTALVSFDAPTLPPVRWSFVLDLDVGTLNDGTCGEAGPIDLSLGEIADCK